MLLFDAGTLSASLPAAFKASGAFPPISNLYLSNNSISGTLPALWGDTDLGWGPTLQRLYLDNNQLTGQLPQLWSDSNSMWALARVDLYNNQLTGPVTWTTKDLPCLGNLVLNPGKSQDCHALTSLTLSFRPLLQRLVCIT